MHLNLKKFRQRLFLLSVSAAYNLIPMVFNVVMAALVVRLLNTALWGDMVKVLLWTGVAGNVMAWGNKDFLIRNFSLAPASLQLEWQRSFGSRSAIFCVVLLVMMLLPISPEIKGWLALYITARFIYMSYDSVVVFKKRFTTTIILEVLAFIITGAGIYFFKPGALPNLVAWFTGAELFKAVAIILLYRKEVIPVFFKSFDRSYFLAASSFFILYFSSMLASKVDLICITTFLGKEEIARYQVLMSFLQATQLSIPMLLLPYLSIIYRLKMASIRRMALRLFMVGMLIASAAVFAVSVILELVYQFQYDPLIFLLGWLIVAPGFYYATFIYRLFKNNRQHIVVIISFIFISCGAAFIFLFVNVLQDKFIAVFVAMALAQWMQGVIYFFVGRKIT